MQDRSSKDGMSSCRIGPVKMGCHYAGWDDIVQDRTSKDGMSSFRIGPVKMGYHHAG